MSTTQLYFDPLDPSVRADPYPHYAELRAAGRVHRNPLGMVVVTRYDDVHDALRDHRLSSETVKRATTPRISGRRRDEPSLTRDYSLLNLDPPDHTRLRRLAAQAFTPRSVSRLRPHIADITNELVGAMATRLRDGEPVDVVSDLAFPLPFVVISEMLGMPLSDTEQVRSWSHAMTRTLEPMATADEFAAGAAAAGAMAEYVMGVIAERRSHPGMDVLSALIAAEESGDKLSTAELVATVMLLYVAGHETTVNLIANGTLALLRHRDQLEAWRADPALGGRAVDELLRYDGPVQFTSRVATEEMELAGEPVTAGELCLLLIGSANHDPDRFDEPDHFDIDRPDPATNLGFGGGIHYCLGAALARTETEIAIGALLAGCPDMDLAGDPMWSDRITLRGLDSLPVAAR